MVYLSYRRNQGNHIIFYLLKYKNAWGKFCSQQASFRAYVQHENNSHRWRPNLYFLLAYLLSAFYFASALGELYHLNSSSPPSLCGLCCRRWRALLVEELPVDPPCSDETVLPGPECLWEAGRDTTVKRLTSYLFSEFRFWGRAWFWEDCQTNEIIKRKIILLNALKRIKIGQCDSNWFTPLDKIPVSI